MSLLSQAESLQHGFEAVEVDVRQVCSESASTLESYARKKAITLDVEMPDEPVRGSLSARALEHVPDDWTGPRDGRPDNQILHPRALAGSMLGVSRTTYAWTWSGAPERVSD